MVSGAPLELNESTQVTLFLPAPHPPLTVDVKVVHRSEAPPGFGLQLDDHTLVKRILGQILTTAESDPT